MFQKLALSIAAFAVISITSVRAEEEGPSTRPGSPVPAFSGTDSTGKTHEITQYKGKVVVLEWLNHGCPFVKKHYGSGNMQKLQEKWTAKDVVWLSVISSAPGKQGHSTPEQAEAEKKEQGSKATAILLDEEGKIGRLFGAQTTPTMVVIDKEGVIAYKGAIDDNPAADPEVIKDSQNYVDTALTELSEGKPVSKAATKSYGCGVKYSD